MRKWKASIPQFLQPPILTAEPGRGELKMRVVTVLHSHGCGGAERHALLLIKQLRQAGHFPIFAGPVDSWLGDQVNTLGIPAFHLPMHGFYDFYSMFRLAWLCRHQMVDVVHGHLTRGAWYAGIGGRLTGTPVVATAHSTNAGKHFNRAQRIVAVSGAVERFMIDSGYQPERICRVCHGVEDHYDKYRERRQDLRKQLALRDDELALCLIARMVRDKGHDILLEALSTLHDKPIQTFFLGDFNTDWGRKMQQLAVAKGLHEKVHFLGHQENVYPFLAAMDVCVAPSRREALSLTLLEAALMGCALLGSKTGGIPEVVQENSNGWLFPPEDPATLATLLQKLSNGELDWKSAGKNARIDVLQRFSLQTMVEETLSVYEAAISERNHG